tara:strand:- start:6108 stop:6722 length:615 start_codon:yes stop_codon:yes gene_type:complete
MSYTDAEFEGTIEDNYNYLINKKPHKSRFINHHLPVLKEYAEKCEHITEFGVDGVNSTWAFLAGKPKTMISVDIRNEKAPEIMSLALDLAKKENIDYKFIESSSHDIEIDETDLLFIDTEHHYDCLSKELSLHPNKVKKYLVFHDTDVKNVGVRKAIVEFLNEDIFNKHNKSQWWNEQKESNQNWKLIYHTNDSEGLTILERQQ